MEDTRRETLPACGSAPAYGKPLGSALPPSGTLG